MYSHDWNMGWGMPFFGIFFWILVIVAVVFIVRKFTEKNPSQYHDKPLDIIKRRYANGEIDKETFERMKKDINQD